MPGTLANSASWGASTRQGAHQEAKTLTTLTLPEARSAGVKVGLRSSSGGSTRRGTGLLRRAEGITLGGGDHRLRNRKKASRPKAATGKM